MLLAEFSTLELIQELEGRRDVEYANIPRVTTKPTLNYHSNPYQIVSHDPIENKIINITTKEQPISQETTVLVYRHAEHEGIDLYNLTDDDLPF